MADKQDSNFTGLRYAEESALKTLPGSGGADAVWHPLEPNGYSDFGGQLATVARNPINPTRQRKKGTVTDLDASGGFGHDFTLTQMTRLLQGFFFAALREKATNLPMNGAQVVCTSVTAADDKYNFGADPGAFLVGSLFLAGGFAVTANNGLKVVTATDADDVTVASGLADETPAATAKLALVGHQFGSGTSAIAMNGSLVRFTDSATDMTTLGLTAGEWVWVGGDVSTTQFTANAPGYARISVIAAGYLEFDKVDWMAEAETGTAKTLHLYFGNVLKNESDTDLIVRRTYQLERTLGEDDNGVMSEYIVGAVPNEMTLNIPQADKMTVDLTFIGLDNEQRNGTTGVKVGTRPTFPTEEALNTSSDFSRIKLSLVSDSDANVSPLFAYATEMTLTLNNNVSALKAIGTLGGFDTTAGTFEVGGNLTAYFANVEAVQAVRNNSDVTLDWAVVKDNKGALLDIPLLSLGDGRLNIEQDQPITLPLEQMAAESRFGHTLLMQFFPYLPTLAA